MFTTRFFKSVREYVLTDKQRLITRYATWLFILFTILAIVWLQVPIVVWVNKVKDWIAEFVF